MINRSLRPIPRWSNGWVVPNYLALGLMSGALWLAFLAQCFGTPGSAGEGLGVLALCTVVLGAALKLAYWRFIDHQRPTSTAGSATGLAALGEVRLFKAPHTSENYLLKDMGFRIARKHASKLRRIALVLGFGPPAILSLVPFAWAGWPAILVTLLAARLAMIGIFVERWLFFAEAKQAVTLYYGQWPFEPALVVGKSGR